jgi:hypothetical protein
MPSFQQPCDIYQGFNFRKDKNVPVGFITSIKIGTVTLAADITAKDPLNPTTDLKCVCVLDNVLWELGVTDAIYFSGGVSTFNRQAVATMLYNSLTNIEVEFKFDAYNYDPLAKKYFKSFHCADTVMKGIVEKVGDNLNVQVADDPSMEVQSPQNFSFSIGIKPQPTQQALTVATGDQKNVVKAWGLTVA